jgi:hypothetical protein
MVMVQIVFVDQWKMDAQVDGWDVDFALTWEGLPGNRREECVKSHVPFLTPGKGSCTEDNSADFFGVFESVLETECIIQRRQEIQ